MATHTCYYEFNGEKKKISTDKYGIDFFSGGFWVDSLHSGSLPTMADVKYWIPPAKILFIEKDDA